MATIVACGVGLASPALAHGVESETMSLPSITSGGKAELSITCSHGYALSGGAKLHDPKGSIRVTASHPKSTRAWAVDVTNSSGRPTAGGEVKITLQAMCGHHH